ncbi:RDD family protein [Streptomyces sp. 4.24]|uniref:RDD family protein n=1 Tax=Streptomyces tritrimontium TaxID=3406573 RepID=UPI003BB6428E
MTASPGDGEHAAREGYYPDPSIPGYVRFWNGLNWVPGTSRPAVAADETGPVFLDETGVSQLLPEPEPEPEPEREPEPLPWHGAERARDAEPGADLVAAAAAWQADPLHQSGFGGPRDHRVSWGNEPAAAAPAPAAVPAPAVTAVPAAGAAARPSGISLARTPVTARVSGSAAPEGVGILSARSPVSTAAAPAPVWPAAPGSPAAPAARPRPAARPAERAVPAAVPAAPVAPVAPVPSATPAPTAHAIPRPATGRAVFERMAERAVRPAGLARRAAARFLDSLVLAAVAAGVALPLLPEATAHIQAKVDAARVSGRTTTVWLVDGTIAGRLALVLGAVLVFGILYEALPTARWGRTPGKKLLGVRVLAAATLRPPGFGAALRRWLVYALLGLPGALWALADRPRRRALHDRAAGTYVAR